jgi:DNA-binding protein HU-beta
MNKAELIEIVAKQTGITKKQATDAVETIFTAITETLKEGRKSSWSALAGSRSPTDPP